MYNEFATLPPTSVKGDLRSFPAVCRAIIFRLKEFFSFSYVAPFGYDGAPNEGTVKFSIKFGAI